MDRVALAWLEPPVYQQIRGIMCASKEMALMRIYISMAHLRFRALLMDLTHLGKSILG